MTASVSRERQRASSRLQRRHRQADGTVRGVERGAHYMSSGCGCGRSWSVEGRMGSGVTHHSVSFRARGSAPCCSSSEVLRLTVWKSSSSVGILRNAFFSGSATLTAAAPPQHHPALHPLHTATLSLPHRHAVGCALVRRCSAARRPCLPPSLPPQLTPPAATTPLHSPICRSRSHTCGGGAGSCGC